MFVLTYATVLVHQLKQAVFTVGVGIVAAVPWILQFSIKYVTNVAVPETVSGLAISAWIIAISIRILKRAKN